MVCPLWNFVCGGQFGLNAWVSFQSAAIALAGPAIATAEMSNFPVEWRVGRTRNRRGMVCTFHRGGVLRKPERTVKGGRCRWRRAPLRVSQFVPRHRSWDLDAGQLGE